MVTAGEGLQSAAISALANVLELGVYDGPPVQAAFPYAVVEAGPENDWGYKGGEGREVRLAVILHDKGERPARLRSLMERTEAALDALSVAEGWQLVTTRFVRSRMVRDAKGVWAGAIEYRARMLRTH